MGPFLKPPAKYINGAVRMRRSGFFGVDSTGVTSSSSASGTISGLSVLEVTLRHNGGGGGGGVNKTDGSQPLGQADGERGAFGGQATVSPAFYRSPTWSVPARAGGGSSELVGIANSHWRAQDGSSGAVVQFNGSSVSGSGGAGGGGGRIGSGATSHNRSPLVVSNPDGTSRGRGGFGGDSSQTNPGLLAGSAGFRGQVFIRVLD